MSRRRIAVVSPFIDKRHGTERRVAEFISRLADEYEFHIYSTRVEDIDLRRVVWHRIPRLPAPHLIAYLWWFLANHVRRWRDRWRGIVPDLVYSPGINCVDADVVSVHIVVRQFRKRAESALQLTQNPLGACPRLLHRRLYYRLIAALENYVYGRTDLCMTAVSKRIAEDCSYLPVISRLHLETRIQFCPPRPDVEACYAAADAYVGPSLDDAFAQPPAEAMACGLPVITSRANGGSEIFTHGCDGFILEDAGDSRMLAKMITNLMTDPALRDRLGTAAAETARRYSWEDNAAQMRELFERAARQRSSR